MLYTFPNGDNDSTCIKNLPDVMKETFKNWTGFHHELARVAVLFGDVKANHYLIENEPHLYV